MSFMLLGILNSQVSGGAAPAMELISTQVLGTTTASVTFSSIPATYKHLQLRIVAQSNSGLAVYGRFNSDTGSNYANHYLIGTGSSVVSSAGTGNDFMTYGRVNTTANAFAPTIIDILDYANTSKNTTSRALQGDDISPTVRLTSSLWLNTSAVTSITMLLNSGSFTTGSRFSLYGIKGE